MKSYKHSLLFVIVFLSTLMGSIGFVQEAFCQAYETASRTANASATKRQNRFPMLIYYSRLTDFQQSIYDELYEGLKAGQEVVTISGVDMSVDEWDVIFTAIQYDHPEIFWYDINFTISVSYDYNDRPTTKFKPELNEWFDDLEYNKRLFKQQVDKILAIARNYPTDDQKEKYIHDYLARTVTYKKTATRETAFAALVPRECTCRGYSAAFKFLLNQLGINAWTISGYTTPSSSTSNGYHAWNIVEINGALYNVDVTFDQVKQASGFNNLNIPSYEYFNLSDEEFEKKDHTRESDVNPNKLELPVASYGSYNVKSHFTETELLNTFAYDLPIQPKIIKSKEDYINTVINVLSGMSFVNNVKKLDMFFLVYGKKASDSIYNMSYEEEKASILTKYVYDKKYKTTRTRTDYRLLITDNLYLHRVTITATRNK